MDKGDKVINKVVVRGVRPRTPGEVLAVRKTETDSEPMALVKFKGYSGPRSTEQSNLEVQP